jgi:hypothetical protein
VLNRFARDAGLSLPGLAHRTRRKTHITQTTIPRPIQSGRHLSNMVRAADSGGRCSIGLIRLGNGMEHRLNHKRHDLKRVKQKKMGVAVQAALFT